MAAEAVLFPPQPLFMVDRSWQRRGRKVSRSKDFENSSRVPEITITVLNGYKASQKRGQGPAIANGNATAKPTQVTNRQFLSYQPQTIGKKDKRCRKKASVKQDIGRVGRPSESSRSSALAPPAAHPAEEFSEHASLSTRSISRSTSPVYTVLDPELGAFEKFLAYYPTRLADAIFPMSRHLNFEYNTLQKIWLPAAMTDEVLLHTILFASALHLHNVSDSHDFKDASLLMKVILDRLNRRLRNKTLSDATIGAVSCLAMCENTVGKHENTAMHMSGMAEMIRVRGGMTAIRYELQMKIHRADISGAVDSFSTPRLPRPMRTSYTLYESLKLGGIYESPLELLLESSRVSPTVADSLVELSELSFAIEHAMDTRTVLDPLIFEQGSLCLQYDLLSYAISSAAGLDKACALGALVYLQTLTRSAPFMRSSSQALSNELKVSLKHLDVFEIDSSLVFWLFVMGGLVSSETSERDWFRQRLRDRQASLTEVITWESMKSQLMSVLWIDRIHDSLGEALWVDLLPPLEF